MTKKILVSGDTLFIPVCKDGEERVLEIFLVEKGKKEKVAEWKVPISDDFYRWDYKAAFPIEQFKGKELEIIAEAPESFFLAIAQGEDRELTAGRERHPKIHFSAETGWINDPNGLIYADGIYHLYYQYNPFHIKWNNMCWGHATSKDLLHWKTEKQVLWPDENGTMFSGCAIANRRGKLDIPETAILYFYTAAGGITDWSKDKEFTQRIVWSTDGGFTLNKIEAPCLDTIYHENRDPSVFWHEESESYIMTLWLKDADYAIFRSSDLEHWEMSQELTLPDTWECPDLFQLKTADGEECWFFWTAGGNYFPGSFDGYTFTPHGQRRQAYLSKLPYAAQIWSETEGRTISVPWLRLENDDRNFTGAMGIPVEFTAKKTEEGFVIAQKPVRELFEAYKPVEIKYSDACSNGADIDRLIELHSLDDVLVLSVDLTPDESEESGNNMNADSNLNTQWNWKIHNTDVSYNSTTGKLTVDTEEYSVVKGCKEILFLVDDTILEVFLDDGVCAGAFQLSQAATCRK